jgi:hypothetical protein
MCWAQLVGALANYRAFIEVEGTESLSLTTSNDGQTLDFGTTANNNLGSVLTSGVWYHITQTLQFVTATTSVIRGYLNGVPNIAPSVDGTAITAPTGITLGNYNGGGNVNPLAGNLRDVRVWIRQLNATEVLAEYQSGVPVSKKGLLFWSPLDDDLVTDRSGNGYTLTTTGTVTLQGGPSRRAYPGRGVNFIR